MTVYLEPGKVWAFDELLYRSIALDGAVSGTHLDLEGRRFSFDHHGKGLRFELSASCRQVLDAILLGMDVADSNIYLNHMDGDVVLAVWIIEHAERWKVREQLSRLWPLVDVVADNDAHGPVYPSRNPELASHFHLKVLAPLHQKPQSCANLTPLKILEEVIRNLETWWANGFIVEPTMLSIVPNFSLEQHGSWAYVRCDTEPEGPAARLTTKVYELGHDRMLLSSPAENGRWKYTIAKRSDFISGFDLGELLKNLNIAEAKAGGAGTWGGSSTIGGSPRPNGSILKPELILNTIENCISGGFAK